MGHRFGHRFCSRQTLTPTLAKLTREQVAADRLYKTTSPYNSCSVGGLTGVAPAQCKEDSGNSPWNEFEDEQLHLSCAGSLPVVTDWEVECNLKGNVNPKT